MSVRRCHRRQRSELCARPPRLNAFSVLGPSDGTTLKDGTRSTRGDHASEFKSAATEQGPILGLGALTAAATDKPHVEELVRVWLIRRLGDTFDEQKPAVRPYRAPAVRENLQRGAVVPVVNHAAENVRVPARGYRLEKITSHDLAALGQVWDT